MANPWTPDTPEWSQTTLEEDTMSMSLDAFDASIRTRYPNIWRHRYIITDHMASSLTSGSNPTTSLRWEMYSMRAEAGAHRRTLKLMDMWVNQALKAGDRVNIVDVLPDGGGTYVVNRERGFVVVNPDKLVPVTGVVGQLWCPRKAALAEILRSSSTNIDCFRGILAHEFIGEAIQQKVFSLAEVQRIGYELIMTTRIMDDGLLNDIDHKSLVQLITEFSPHVLDMLIYFNNAMLRTGAVQTRKIKSIPDIEDFYNNPVFGLKGKVDAVAEIAYDGYEKCIPLEFKTGTNTGPGRFNPVRSEHVGQVLLYFLLMRERHGHNVDGQLLYLRNNLRNDVTSTLGEMQSLMMHRNTLAAATVFHKGTLSLPTPDVEFDHKCVGCEFRTECALLNPQPSRSPDRYDYICSETVRQLDGSLNYLSPAHRNFFDKWAKFLIYEHEDAEKSFNLKGIWKSPVSLREKNGLAMSGLRLIYEDPPVRVTGENRILIRFSLDKVDPKARSNILVGDYVLVSSEFEVGVAYGTVSSVMNLNLLMTVDRPLSKRSVELAMGIFTIDKVTSYSPFATLMSYLTQLMEGSSSRLREIIINKRQPVFGKFTNSQAVKYAPLLDRFNLDQKRIILKALSTDTFFCVKGMPGTGKTETICGLIEMIVNMGLTALVVGYTGSSVFNIFSKLQPRFDNFCLVTNETKLPPALGDFVASRIAKAAANIDDLRQIYTSRPVVGSTLLSLKHPICFLRKFDFCIVDETSQAVVPSVFGSLMLADRYIFFGDDYQLPAIIKSEGAKDLGLEDNFLTFISSPANTAYLSTQYRMNSAIMDLANKLVYGGQLKCGLSTLMHATIVDSSTMNCANLVYPFMAKVLSASLDDSVVFINTEAQGSLFFETQVENSISNTMEAHLVKWIVEALFNAGIEENDIGIIAPFRGQVALLKTLIHAHNPSVEVNTVDQYQGREKKVIICTFAKSNDKITPLRKRESGEFKTSILDDVRRLNVAITRAQLKLVLIGNSNTLKVYHPFARLIRCLEHHQMVDIVDIPECKFPQTTEM